MKRKRSIEVSNDSEELNVDPKKIKSEPVSPKHERDDNEADYFGIGAEAFNYISSHDTKQEPVLPKYEENNYQSGYDSDSSGKTVVTPVTAKLYKDRISDLEAKKNVSLKSLYNAASKNIKLEAQNIKLETHVIKEKYQNLQLKRELSKMKKANDELKDKLKAITLENDDLTKLLINSSEQEENVLQAGETIDRKIKLVDISNENQKEVFSIVISLDVALDIVDQALIIGDVTDQTN